MGKASIISEFAATSAHMAKSDSFFIRSIVNTDAAGNYAQEEIDLGSFVNLGVKSSTLLRIHNIQVQYADGTTAAGASPELPMSSQAAGGGKIAWQLCTQSQTSLVTADDKSLVSCGSMTMYGDDTAAHAISATHDFDVNPQQWTNGYLVGVDSLFFGGEAGGTVTSGDSVVAIVMECTLESATQASATALALSQQ